MKKDISVLLWLYHTDMAQEFYDILHPLKDILDIHLGLCKDNSNNKALSIFNDLPIGISYHNNVGADTLPFLEQLQGINNPIFIKLHSKQSNWGLHNRGNWRLMLVDSLLSSKNSLLRNTDKIKNHNIGYVGCSSFMCHNFELKNKEKIKELEYKLYLPKVSKKIFCGGNMFMGKTLLYKKTLDKRYNMLHDLLSTEKGKVSDIKYGTYCHAMERILGYISNNEIYTSENCHLNTIKILSKNTDHEYLRLRILPNNEIYCTEQPNIYGKIIEQNTDSFTVEWYHIPSKKHQYQLISKNTYINKIHT
tara:strand:+ start:225 stop:1142 length:918 start_codon:yes stop_codon:yes gene_type:complete